MDNFIINVVCGGRAMFDSAMEIAFKQDYPNSPKTAKHYVIDEKLGFVFLWSKEGESAAFPFPLEWQRAADMAWDWLQQAKYPKKPDLDGSSEEGWRVYCEFWGHVGDYHYAIVAVQPEWAWYGK